MKVRRKIPVLVVIVSALGAALIGLLVYGVMSQAANRTLDEALARGEHPLAPDATMTLPVLGGGGSSSLAAYRGKVVLLNFWASWCLPCQEEAHLLEHAERALSADRATVLGVTFQDAAPDSESFVRKYGLTYPNMRDATGEFAQAFGTRQVPESFIINRTGHIMDISRGEIGPSFVKEALAIAEQS